jgi:hypothetical protein
MFERLKRFFAGSKRYFEDPFALFVPHSDHNMLTQRVIRLETNLARTVDNLAQTVKALESEREGRRQVEAELQEIRGILSTYTDLQDADRQDVNDINLLLVGIQESIQSNRSDINLLSQKINGLGTIEKSKKSAKKAGRK